MNAMDRITAIQKSLWAFQCGVVGFLPVIGLIPSIVALVFYFRVRRGCHDWNPAAKYLKWGGALGFFGVVNSCLGFLVIGIAMLAPWNG